MTPTAGHKRRWSSRIRLGTIIRRTSLKSHRLSDSISFDQDAEFIPRSRDESGKRFPHVALDIQPTRTTLSGTPLCTIAESPLREAEATQSVARLSSCGPLAVDEINTPSSESFTSQAVSELSNKPGPSSISRVGEMPATSPSTNQDLHYNEPQARGPSQTDTKDQDEAEASRSESTNEVSAASFYEMAHSNSVPSHSSSSSRCQLPHDLGHIETCLPLMTPYNTRDTLVTAHGSDENVISWSPYSVSSDKLEKLHNIGWLEYHFPNGNLYYFHPQRKISTEVDLTNDSFLDLVEDFWQEQGMDMCSRLGLRRNPKFGGALNVSIEDEIWLKDVGLSSKMMFEMWLVDHVARTVVLASQEIDNGSAASIQEDQIDMEHRYWAFMQSHPAHTVLPPHAKSAAINTLAWAWTDHLLSLRDSDSIPFTREECRDLMTLLQSLIVEEHHHQVIQTCIVSRVFLQVAQWHKFHPYDKASPTDTSSSISIRSSESLNRLPDPPPKPEKSWIAQNSFLNIVIFLSIVIFTLVYALSQHGLVFTQAQIFVDKIIGLLPPGQRNALLSTLNWTSLRCTGGLRDRPD